MNAEQEKWLIERARRYSQVQPDYDRLYTEEERQAAYQAGWDEHAAAVEPKVQLIKTRSESWDSYPPQTPAALWVWIGASVVFGGLMFWLFTR